MNKAVNKHVKKIEEAERSTIKTPYEMFVSQWFNTNKDETAGRYFISNENKYKQFNFNEDNQSEMERKFQLKEDILKQEGVVRDRKPDA